MSSPRRPTQFGRIHTPDEAWLGRRPVEPVLEPALPVIDTHHHLWQRPDHRYLLHEFLADAGSGHDVVATVFVECHSMYRARGPAPLRPVGETEFVAGIAAMSESGQYGPTRIAAGIVGFADLTLGARVEPVLEAHVRAGGGRFRGVRHAAAWDASDVIGNSRTATGPHLMRQASFRAGLARLTALGLSLDAWVFHPQLDDVVDLARSAPDATIIVGHATFCVVVVYNNVVARLRRLGRSLEEASMDLGADTWTTFRRITFPSLATALFAGALLAFALSFDEIIVTTFTAGTEQTLPIWIFANFRLPNARPIVNVVALAMILLSLIPVYVSARLAGAESVASAR